MVCISDKRLLLYQYLSKNNILMCISVYECYYRLEIIFIVSFHHVTEYLLAVTQCIVREKIIKHGEDVWVIMFCDNLNAHLDEEVKQIFGDGKVLLFIFLQT